MTKLSNLLAPVAALALLAGCAPTFEARVARFQMLPPPAGQTFTVQARDSAKAGSLEFATYANLVRQRLTGDGFAEAAPGQASLVVTLDYAVGPPREKIETRPGFGYGGFGYGGFGYGAWGYPGWGYGGFGGYGRYGRFGGFYGGGFEPWSYPEVYSTTQYNGFLAMRITRTADNSSVFEGRAETVAQTNDLTRLVPNLVTALFTNFPGRSGETVRVSFDPSQPSKPAVIKPGR